MSSSNSLSTRSEPINGQDAAEILGVSYPAKFNETRRRLEKVVDPATGKVRDYPTTDELVELAEQLGSTADEADAHFRREHILAVPAWGGLSFYGGHWRYDRSKCEQWHAAIVGSVT